MRLWFFVGSYYLKYCLIILTALELFFIGIDSLQYADRFPDAANLLLLFFIYDGLYALNYTLPISLLLGLVLFYIAFIRSNQYGALLAIGYSIRQILNPMLTINLFFIIVFVGLNATPFVYMQEKAMAIIYKDNGGNISENLLVKYNNDYVYFGKINPLLQSAQNIKIFTLKHDELNAVAQADHAAFENKYWTLHNATIATLPTPLSLGHQGLHLESVPLLKTLRGFHPKVLDTIYQNKPAVSITDAFRSLHVLYRQHGDTKKIRGFLYVAILTPFFVPLTAILIARYTPNLARYENLALLSLKFIILALILWGLFFALGKFSIAGLFYPEFGIVIPFAILCGVTLHHYRKLDTRL
ncbi:LptF/LptG family permease [Helicobacter cynogastricus]|uniref:LptF/LptG family permease n=1 Tax=Helicobacter cynogastricus TaxID=329937 RepID=UPI000CF13EAA|nr:LptF/LptG family permease [Helicobacter cynogastricus]